LIFAPLAVLPMSIEPSSACIVPEVPLIASVCGESTEDGAMEIFPALEEINPLLTTLFVVKERLFAACMTAVPVAAALVMAPPAIKFSALELEMVPALIMLLLAVSVSESAAVAP
jgi:hypothetical protein